ncbi:MAG TPA: HEAT repeat domain-containing protein, partial [Acidobacteriota bacterium]|nr:HEAT repeat domain-containing protein [Acidobacteriota bacterium]
MPVPPDIQKAQRQYLDYVVRWNRKLEAQGIMPTHRSVTLPLDEIFVRLTCDTEKTEFEPLKRRLEKSKLGIVETPGFDNEFLEDWPLAEHLSAVVQPEDVDLSRIIAHHRQVVILGDPGSGKTTLMRFLAFHFAREFRDHGPQGIVTDKDGQTYGAARFPILIRISTYAEELRLNHNTSFREFLAVPFGDTGIELPVLKRIFDQVLQDGEALVLLDGLDEVTEFHDRSQRIASFVSAVSPRNHFVVTSRIAGYRVARLSGDFQQFTLRKFDKPQIEVFLNQWCLAVEQFHYPDLAPSDVGRLAQQEIDGILQAVHESRGVLELVSNPLMLIILALIHRNGKRLPSCRIELYDLAVKTRLRDWQLQRGLRIEHVVKEKDALLFLAPLAYWMHQERPTGLIKTSEVKARLMPYLAYSRQVSVEDEKIEEDVDDFLRRVREHTGVFVERTTGWYGFMHLTFEEYFVAREIARRAKESAEKIYPYRHHPRWHEPIMLAIGFISTDRPDDASELIQIAILGKGEEAQKLGFAASPFENVLHRDLLYAIQCLGDCDSTESVFRKQIVNSLIEVYFESTNRQLNEKVEQTLERLKGSDLEADVVGLTLSYLEDEDDQKRAKAITILRRIEVSTPQLIDRILDKLADQNENVRIQVIVYFAQFGNPSPEVLKKVFASIDTEQGMVLNVVPLLFWKMEKLSPAIETILEAYLERGEFVVQLNIASRLSGSPEAAIRATGKLIERMKGLSGIEKGQAMLLIGVIGCATRMVIQALVEQLEDQNPAVREDAVMGLSELLGKSPDVLPILLKYLNDTNKKVRRPVVRAPGKIPD